MQELAIYEVFPAMQPHENLYAGSFDSNNYPYKPAPPVRCNYYWAGGGLYRTGGAGTGHLVQ
ncbi:hypothetical protein GCM10023187_46610 [Nibrella viscosa]|uniref:Uncharacterized protein n=1 Tax=Nibrella viscosa TaxID=1084524 RepID=A0ABP8KU63_9BACT